jgi:HEAT repeat protein
VLPLLNREKTRVVAFYTLGHLRAQEAFEPALAALTDPKEGVRLRAAQALGRIGDRRATAELLRALDDELWDVRYAAEYALVAFGKSSVGPLRSAFVKASTRAKPHILEALAKLDDKRALSWARSIYKKNNPMLRKAVEKQLAEQLAAARKH